MTRMRWLAVGMAVLAVVGVLGAVMLGSNAGRRLETSGPGQQQVNQQALAAFKDLILECKAKGSPDEPAGASRCLDQVIIDNEPKMGVVTTLAGLRWAVEEHGDVFAELCHRNAHYVGEYAGRTSANIDVALGLGGPDCEFGYDHGVVEGYASVTPNLWQELPTICSKLSTNKNSYVYQECSHSLGHAIVTRTDNDVNAGVEKCKLMSTESERSACATGIFMSWSNTLDKRISGGQPLDGKWAWAPKDARWEGCLQFDDVMAGGCMLYFSETAPHTVDGLKAFRSWCMENFAGHEMPLKQCHRGVGRVSGADKEFYEFGRWKGIVKLCTEGYSYDEAAECAQEAYTIAAGFQRNHAMVVEACEAWDGFPEEQRAAQCKQVEDIFRVVTADTGLKSDLPTGPPSTPAEDYSSAQ